ncbi:hypothetical protein CRM22_001616 [Opisthorchis felineus]|uniref:Uncharacterized protein n=1 Tax=Opisthorchis felineus TaxID=147828 RepID=A0A4S2M9U6_OPIFE|nr:hypothetical protein CRM22_001616 [Opisthorchis felineus]
MCTLLSIHPLVPRVVYGPKRCWLNLVLSLTLSRRNTKGWKNPKQRSVVPRSPFPLDTLPNQKAFVLPSAISCLSPLYDKITSTHLPIEFNSGRPKLLLSPIHSLFLRSFQL